MKKIFKFLLVILTSVLLVSCTKDDSKTIYVAASPKPHAEILEFAKPILKEKGYDLVIKRVSDYETPNQALVKKQVDANFFQHIPFLNQYNQENNTNIISLGEVHIEPIGIYSKRYKSINELKENDTIFISQSKSDHSRLLNLLNNAGLLNIPNDVDILSLNIEDLLENPSWNPNNYEINYKTLPESLTEVYKYDQAALVLINSNFVLEDDGIEISDALILEEAKNNPYANIIASLEEFKNLDKIKALVEVLTSKEVKDFIIENYNNDIIPS